MPPVLYVIILNWNHKEDLILTIDSFLNQDYSNFKIVVADNGSTDGSIEYIKMGHADVILIENSENLGYAAGNNRAIEYALSQNADFVLLANNDIFLDNPNLISKIMDEIQSYEIGNIGIYGIQERNYYLQNKVESEGLLLFDDFSTPKIQFNIIRVQIAEDLPYPAKYVDFVPGSFILIKSEVFKKCGLLDEAFFMYHEEAEFCFRAWIHNFKVVVNPSLQYYHKVAQSSGNRSPFSIYYRLRNNYYFLFKHKRDIKHYRFFLFLLTYRNLIGFLKLTILLFFKINRNKDIWKAQLIAYKDVFMGNYFKQNKVD